MPIAAVPEYLGQEFRSASPGMRFGMYLKLWGVNSRTKERLWTTSDISYRVSGQRQEERPYEDQNKGQALKDASILNASDKELMAALGAKQRASFDATCRDRGALRISATAIAPFTTGLGNEHPLENGFSFLNPYGLPYLPGSGVKGVLRQAARELASGQWGDAHGWSEQKNIALKRGPEAILLSVIDVLFGLESEDGKSEHVRGVLTFWDVIPQVAGNALLVDVMTPHQSHYYQQKPERKSGDSATPHDSGSPNPITFLTVPPDSQFVFHVQCELTHLQRLCPELAESDRWKSLITAAFEHAFDWLGFGAKTSVGYGAMGRDKQAEQQAQQKAEQARQQAQRAAEQAQAEAEKAARRQALSANMIRVDEFIESFRARAQSLAGGKRDKPNTEYHARAQQLVQAAQSEDWTLEEKRAVADAVAEWLPKVVAIDMKDERKKLKLAALRGEGG